MTERVEIWDQDIRLVGLLERPNPENCPLVIVLHGFTSSKDRPHTVAACKAMAEAGFASLRFDLYGHGESGGTFRTHTLQHWVSNTLAVLNFVNKLDFVTEVWFSGHSQGGLTAALAAGQEPEQVRGLILRAPAFMIPHCARAGNLLGQRFDPEQIPAELPTIKNLRLDGAYIRIAQTIHVEDAIDSFPGPVLILQGDRDEVVPLRDVQAAASRYQNCKLEVLEGETHHFNQYPERMQAAIQRFLKEWNCSD